MTVFSDVKGLLDAQIAAWSAKNNGQVPQLVRRHGDASFKWTALADLKAAEVVKGGKTYPLLDLTKIGQKGEGAKMNLIVALANPSGVNNFGEMPDQGPFMDPTKIAIIADWIDGGCPE